MSGSGRDYVRRQIEGRFYAEALYFGALELARAPSPELHLYLGLACCGSCGGIADVQRIIHGEPQAPSGGGGRPMAGNTSRLVYEGFYHLLEAARHGLRVPEVLAPVAVAILDDLRWYLREDFKGSASARKLTLKEAASGATALVRRLLSEPPPVPEDLAFELRRGEEIVDQELPLSAGDAAFYDLARVLPKG